MPKKTSKSRQTSPARSDSTASGLVTVGTTDHSAQSAQGECPTVSATGRLLPAFEFGLHCAEFRWFRAQALAARNRDFWDKAFQQLLKMQAIALRRFSPTGWGLFVE